VPGGKRKRRWLRHGGPGGGGGAMSASAVYVLDLKGKVRRGGGLRGAASLGPGG